MLRHAHRTATGSAHHQHTPLGRFIQVDIVHAHARATYHPQFGRFVEQGRCNFRGAAYDQSLGIRQFRHQLSFVVCTTFQPVCFSSSTPRSLILSATMTFMIPRLRVKAALGLPAVSSHDMETIQITWRFAHCQIAEMQLEAPLSAKYNGLV